GWAALVVAEGTPPSLQNVALDKALTDPALAASFVLSSKVPDLSGNGAAAVVQRVRDVVKSGRNWKRAFVWLREGRKPEETPTLAFGLQDGVAQTTAVLRNDQLTAQNGFGVLVNSDLTITVTAGGGGLSFETSGSNPAVAFTGAKRLAPF